MRDPTPQGALESVAATPAETAGRRPSQGTRRPAVSTPRGDAAIFCADQIKSPAPLETARARHRRYQLPCDTDLMDALMRLVGECVMPGRDRRHESSAAWPQVQAWLRWLDLEGKSERTKYAYERSTAPLLRTYPAKLLADFTASDVNDELHAIPPRSRYISRSIYNQLFEWAEFHDHVDRSPMGKVARMKAGHRRPNNIFSAKDVADLQALPVPDGPLWTLLFGTGLRRAEARHLRRSHIDLSRMRLTVYNGKGDKTADVPFGVTVAAAVADLDLLERLEPTDHLWYLNRWPVGDRRRRRDPIGDTTFSRGPNDPSPGWYERGILAAGVRYLNPHQTRHTYHWLLRSAKVDLEDRQVLMRHSSPETTVRQYGRHDLEEIAAKVAGF